MKNHTNTDYIVQLRYPKSRSGKLLPFDILTTASSFCFLYLALRAVANEPLKICLWHNFEIAEFPIYALSGYNKSYELFLMNYL